MSRREDWCKMPRTPSTEWSADGLDGMDKIIARDLLALMDSEVWEGSLDALLTRYLRNSETSSRQRQRLRMAFERMRQAGLLFAHEGSVYLLFSEQAVRKHRALRDAARAQHVLSMCSAGAAHVLSACRDEDVTSRSHSGVPSQRERERERINPHKPPTDGARSDVSGVYTLRPEAAPSPAPAGAEAPAIRPGPKKARSPDRAHVALASALAKHFDIAPELPNSVRTAASKRMRAAVKQGDFATLEDAADSLVDAGKCARGNWPFTLMSVQFTRPRGVYAVQSHFDRSLVREGV